MIFLNHKKMIEMIKKTVHKDLEQHFRTFPTQISGHTIHFYWKMLQMHKTCNKTMCKVRTNAKFIKPTCLTCTNPSIWPLISSLTCTQPILMVMAFQPTHMTKLSKLQEKVAMLSWQHWQLLSNFFSRGN